MCFSIECIIGIFILIRKMVKRKLLYPLNIAVLFAAILFLSCSYSRASSSGNPWTHTFYFENDLFSGTDSNYTNGVKYSLISPNLSPKAPQGQLPQKVMEYVHRLPFIQKSSENYTHKAEFAIGQNMYTPSDISRSDLITDDRPYAGWSYFSLAYHRKNEFSAQLDFLDTVEVQIGIVGPQSYAEETQKFVHDLRRLQRPNGWDHQIKNEPGVNLVFERKWLFYSTRSNPVNIDVITHAGASLGNVSTYLNAGLEVRLGWNIPKNFGVSLIRPAGSTRLMVEDGPFSIYIFGATNNRFVMRDIFLDGNTFAHSHSVDRKDWVSDLGAGICIGYKMVTLTFSQILRTEEFHGQDGNHSFGSVTLSFSADFF